LIKLFQFVEERMTGQMYGHLERLFG